MYILGPRVMSQWLRAWAVVTKNRVWINCTHIAANNQPSITQTLWGLTIFYWFPKALHRCGIKTNMQAKHPHVQKLQKKQSLQSFFQELNSNSCHIRTTWYLSIRPTSRPSQSSWRKCSSSMGSLGGLRVVVWTCSKITVAAQAGLAPWNAL